MEKIRLIDYDPWLKPYAGKISERRRRILAKIRELSGTSSLKDFAGGHLYFGVHFKDGKWIFREWAPNATAIYLVGDFNHWTEDSEYRFNKIGPSNWELVLDQEMIQHLDQYKIRISWKGGKKDRIPAWAGYVVQDEISKNFNACIWNPPVPYQWKHPAPENHNESPLIYEAHVGMATEEYKTGTYNEFREKILPLVKKAGYNTLQLMAVQEHPYYGSFGYHVSSFFAPSSRFGTPDDLKALVDEAHGAGLNVIMDLVHSHAVKNELEGIGNYDGSGFQFFHTGIRREHIAWDSLCFNYGKNEVIHFLLSNIQHWLSGYNFDGFRFDGVTSMLYYDHGLGRDFTSYDMYFDDAQDEDAITYLGLANTLIKEIKPHALSIAEEMSGYPGLGSPVEDGGLGFTHRMAMGTPDYWIKIIKERKDEEWNVEEMFYELTRKRAEEKTVGYSESHDQALVGDKTIIFRLIDKDMYFSMDKASQNLVVDRGIALHKLIRLITIGTSGNAYLNFMGNEFGHPEWIDFPREGNDWSYQHARRQWSLASDPGLKYSFLGEFDSKMIALVKEFSLLKDANIILRHCNPSDQVISFERAGLYFVFNFNPVHSFADYGLYAVPGSYRVLLSSDQPVFGGQGRIDESINYRTFPERTYIPNQMLKIYLPSRTAVILKRTGAKSIDNLLHKG